MLLKERESQLLALQHLLNDKDAQMSELTSAFERLKTETPDTGNLLATIESDKVAASRAVAQNQQLKLQLDEIQRAYVQLVSRPASVIIRIAFDSFSLLISFRNSFQSNDKLDLTTKLQSEQHLAREIKANFGGLEQELSSVREKLHFKDEEMIRLSHANTELDKEILQLSQEVDRYRHYDAATNENTSFALQQQLQAAKQEIRRLKAKGNESGTESSQAESGAESRNGNDSTVSSCVDGHNHNHNDHHDHHSHDNSCHNTEGTISNSSTATLADDKTDCGSVSSTINIATNEAMQKLQARFKRTMNEIADLTEEKQRLEHLVLQLQGETETIGEYIALYQTQRRLLKRREVEKDIQLHRIAADRQEMKEKLLQLNGLVELLLVENGLPNARQFMEKLNIIGDVNAFAEKVVNGESVDQAHAAEEVDAPLLNDSGESGALSTSTASLPVSPVSPVSAYITPQPVEHTGGRQDTAKKIIHLLADIRDKNLKQDFTSVPNSLHHCPCCSGKLEVV